MYHGCPATTHTRFPAELARTSSVLDNSAGASMTSAEFAALSTRIFGDLTKWVAEASKDDTLSSGDLAVLQTAMKIVERVTYTEAEIKPDTAN
jgi:hypothetical protein